PIGFWRWLIRTVREAHPDVVFLSEAFTSPPRMYALAKAGFSQSYTYFTWKNSKDELTDYVSELAGPVSEFFRPNLFTNTPDILHAYLHEGGRTAFGARWGVPRPPPSAGGPAAGVPGPAGPRPPPLAELRHLLGVRQPRAHARRAGQRGVPRL